ncbi:hypothetical protein BG011_008239 [Mortierella polycephala]|uniref:Uncharacterized protein n=1 Tax=Mortierella polycephala TaxID=41804 RepID=A0A9P6QAU8_9FUNG|nr:hypothetical protein BG011_008239 [Mortierella polycephala]
MKFITTVAVVASSMVAMATADLLQINNPTVGSVWTIGKKEFVGWSGNCASMGNAGKNVTVDLVEGPAGTVRYVATLGTLDCSGSLTRADFEVPETIKPGEYAIVVRTEPSTQASYTNAFEIKSGQATPSSPSTSTNPTPTAAPDNAAGSLNTNVMFVLAGAVAVAFQLL